jgi:hypothetical protein
MTGVKPKSEFCQPDLLVEIVVEIARQVVIQYVLGYKPLVPVDIGKDIIDSNYRKKESNK